MRRYVWYEDLDNRVYCPNCTSPLDCYYRGALMLDEIEPYEPRFCPECGTELDWTRSVLYGTIEEHN